MSAWGELVTARDGDEWLELCSRALEEVQRETSRRNAAKIRARYPLRYTRSGDRTGTSVAADLIDPEVQL
ncbi:hypothetical protein AB0I84_45295 [Streptomyces spectabilis]|uniref:hypothetical protein n=1 Tax=Streptomyces spectabilis TaxID=68270 RepID=UPI0033D4C99C